jgi:hypothetical protein
MMGKTTTKKTETTPATVAQVSINNRNAYLIVE